MAQFLTAIDKKNKIDELSTVPLGAPGVHLREVLEDAFH
jgi:hypothetical protein